MSLRWIEALPRWTRRAFGMSRGGGGQRSQLLVDVSILVKNDAGTGIQRVVRALSEQLVAANLQNFDIRFIAATRRRGYRYLTDGIANGSRTAGRVSVRAGDIFFALDLANRVLPRHGRQVRKWRNAGVKISAMVYDLLPVTYPHWFSASQAASFHEWLDFLADHADQAVCISQVVAGDLAEWMEREGKRRAAPLDIVSIPLGGDISSSKPSSGVTDDEARAVEALSSRQFMLMVGTIEPRKGHSFVLDALDLIWTAAGHCDLTLVLVGRPGWKTDDLQQRLRSHREKGGRLFWFEDASDELLDRLYGACAGVLLPSLAEGLGLPLLEAASKGLPVLARDLPVFREQQLPNISYFADDTPSALADKIVAWQDEASYHKSDQVKLLQTWKKSCDELIQVLGVK